jgi:hypothetical protein
MGVKNNQILTWKMRQNRYIVTMIMLKVNDVFSVKKTDKKNGMTKPIYCKDHKLDN